MQVRKCFARRHDAISVIYASFVQGRKHIDSPLRLLAEFKQGLKLILMTPDKIIDALMRAAKRLSVGRENKNICWNSLFQVSQRSKPLTQRIGQRFSRPNADI